MQQRASETPLILRPTLPPPTRCLLRKDSSSEVLERVCRAVGLSRFGTMTRDSGALVKD